MKFTPAQLTAIAGVAKNFGIEPLAMKPGIYLDGMTKFIINSNYESDQFKGMPQVGISDNIGGIDETPASTTLANKVRDAISEVFKALPKEKFKPKVEHDSAKQGQEYTAPKPEERQNASAPETKKANPIPEKVQEVKPEEQNAKTHKEFMDDVKKIAIDIGMIASPPNPKSPPVKMCAECGIEITHKRAQECFASEEPFTCNEECAEKFRALLIQKAHETVPLKKRVAKEMEIMPPQELGNQSSRTIPGKVVTQKGLMIKNLTLKCAEIGGIRIGTKGENTTGSGYRLPQKLDHFIVTTPNKDKAGNFILDDVMGLLPENPRILDIMMLYDDETMNFSTQYREMKGGRVVCSGDGEKAFDKEAGQEIICNTDTCPKYLAKKCKLNGTLSVILLNKPTIGGVYRFRTTGWNSVQSIMTSMLMIKTLTRGLLAMIPLKLTLTPKLVTPKGTDKAHTIYFVNIEYHGSDLLEQVIKISNHRLAMQTEIKKLETQSLLAAPESEEELKDIQEEFYPGQV